MQHRRTALAVVAAGAVLGVVALMLTSCRPASTTGAEPGASTLGPPKPGGKVVYGIEADPNGLDPSKNGWDPSGLLVANAIYDTLAAFDRDGKPQPYLAASFSHNAAFTEWTVKLRPGITFHDGTKLDADALLRFTQSIVDSPITGPAAVNVDHSDKVDDLTVTTTMKQPWASYPVQLTGQGGTVASPKQLDDPDGSLHPSGTGPFQLKQWDVDQKVVVVRNPHYWRNGLPYLDEVEFRPASAVEKRLDLLANGTFNVIHSSDATANARLDSMAKDGTIQAIHDRGVTEPNFIMFNTTKAPLDDVRVRRALSYATDPGVLVDAIGGPRGRIADGPFPAESPWYVKTDLPTSNLAKARELIGAYQAEKGPISFKLGGPPDPANLKVMQAVIAQWKQLGIDVEIDTIEFKQFVIRAVLGSFDAVVFRYFGSPDPDQVWHFWSGETYRPPGQISLDFTRLRDPEIDAALNAGRATDDVSKRKDAYATVQRRFSELVPYIWFYRTDWVIAAAPFVHGLENGTLPDGTSALPLVAGVHRLTETWIEKDAGTRH